MFAIHQLTYPNPCPNIVDKAVHEIGKSPPKLINFAFLYPVFETQYLFRQLEILYH